MPIGPTSPARGREQRRRSLMRRSVPASMASDSSQSVQYTESVAAESVAPDIERQSMVKVTVEVLVDDLDGSDGAETVRLGWNGDWREIDLSRKNRASLTRALDRYWNAARPVTGLRSSSRRAASSRSTIPAKRDPKMIRAWATEHGIAVPSRGRIPTVVEDQYNQAMTRP